MSVITVKYVSFNSPEVELGRETAIDIPTARLPHNPEGKNIFIRKVFVGHKHESWRVEKIDFSQGNESELTCTISLSPVLYGPTSISEKHSSNGSKLLRGRLVECDFGYFTQDVSCANQLSTNIKDFDTKLPFEMVKRRLVVVISSKEDPALVIPISKSGKAKNDKTVVELTSLPEDLVTFKEQTCYAKASAVSYVSGHRLFPLRFFSEKGKKTYDYRVEKKLSNEDVCKIKEAVLIGVGGQNILTEAQKLKADSEQKDNEIETLQMKLVESEKKYHELWELLEEQTEN